MDTIFIPFVLFWRKLTFWKLRFLRLKCFTNIKNKDQLWYEPSNCPSLKYCLNVNWIICLNEPMHHLAWSYSEIIEWPTKIINLPSYLFLVSFCILTKFLVKKRRIFYTWCLSIDFASLEWVEEEGPPKNCLWNFPACHWVVSDQQKRKVLPYQIFVVSLPCWDFLWNIRKLS